MEEAMSSSRLFDCESVSVSECPEGQGLESAGSRTDALTAPRTTDCLIKNPTVRKKADASY